MMLSYRHFLKRPQLFVSQHNIISQNALPCIRTAVRTLDLETECFNLCIYSAGFVVFCQQQPVEVT